MKKKLSQSKVDLVNDLVLRYKDSKDFFFTDYRGLTVEQLTALRRKLRPLSAEMKVVKNNLAKIVFKTLDYAPVDEYLKGPTTVVNTTGEESSQVARILSDYTSESSLIIKGGLVDRDVYTAEQVISYGKLPTRPEAIIQFMGILNGAMSKLARTLQALSESKTE